MVHAYLTQGLRPSQINFPLSHASKMFHFSTSDSTTDPIYFIIHDPLIDFGISLNAQLMKLDDDATQILSMINNGLDGMPVVSGSMMINMIHDTIGDYITIEPNANGIHIEMGDLKLHDISDHLIQELSAHTVTSYHRNESEACTDSDDLLQLEKSGLDIKESSIQSINLRTTDGVKHNSSHWLSSKIQPDAGEALTKFNQTFLIEKHYQSSGSSPSSENSGSVMLIDYDINQLMTRFTPKATYGLKQSAKAWIHHVQQLSDYSDYAPSFDSYTKSRLNHLERFWYDKTKLMYYGDPPLLMDTIKDYQWYFDVANPIVFSI